MGVGRYKNILFNANYLNEGEWRMKVVIIRMPGLIGKMLKKILRMNNE